MYAETPITAMVHDRYTGGETPTGLSMAWWYGHIPVVPDWFIKAWWCGHIIQGSHRVWKTGKKIMVREKSGKSQGKVREFYFGPKVREKSGNFVLNC